MLNRLASSAIGMRLPLCAAAHVAFSVVMKCSWTTVYWRPWVESRAIGSPCFVLARQIVRRRFLTALSTWALSLKSMLFLSLFKILLPDASLGTQ